MFAIPPPTAEWATFHLTYNIIIEITYLARSFVLQLAALAAMQTCCRINNTHKSANSIYNCARAIELDLTIGEEDDEHNCAGFVEITFIFAMICILFLNVKLLICF